MPNIAKIVVFLPFLATAHPAFCQGFRIDVIGVQGRFSLARDINDSGVAAITVLGAGSLEDPFAVPGFSLLEIAGQQEVLGGLGGTSTEVFSVNNQGRAVGFSTVGTPLNSPTEGVLFAPGDDARVLASGTDFIPLAINDSGIAVGGASGDPAVVNADGRFFNLSDILGSGSANAINDLGQIVGTAALDGPPNARVPFLLDNEEVTSLGLGSGTAAAINNLGVVVGNTNSDGRTRAFSFSEGLGVQFLDDLSSTTRATDINDSGTIIGAIVESGETDAFIFDEELGFRLLIDEVVNDAGLERLFTPNAINNRGQIVGLGLIDGQARAVLLTPVPEPTALWMALAFAAMIGALGTRQRQRRLQIQVL